MEELLELTYSIEQDSVSPSDLLPLYMAINKLLQSADFDQINQYFIELDTARTATLPLIGILRLCNGARMHLPYWTDLGVLTYYELINRGEDPEIILNGLLDVTTDAHSMTVKAIIQNNYTDHIIQLVGIELANVDPETRRLAEQVVEMEINNPDRRSLEDWSRDLGKYLTGPLSND